MKNIKRLLALLLAVLLTATCTSCAALTDLFGSRGENPDSKPDPKPTSRQVWLRTEYCTQYVDSYTQYYYYDEYGYEIKSVRYTEGDDTPATWYSEYDENHNLVQRGVDSGSGELFVQLIQVYDDAGRLIEKRSFTTMSETVTTYHYDAKGNLITLKDGDGDVLKVYTYGSDGRLASVKDGAGTLLEVYSYEADGTYRISDPEADYIYDLYTADGRILESHLGYGKKYVYTYNENGVLLEKATWQGSGLTEKTVYHLDANGNNYKTTRISQNGAETLVSESKYQLFTVKLK